MLQAQPFSRGGSTHYVHSGIALTREVQRTGCEVRKHFDKVLQEAHLGEA